MLNVLNFIQVLRSEKSQKDFFWILSTYLWWFYFYKIFLQTTTKNAKSLRKKLALRKIWKKEWKACRKCEVTLIWFDWRHFIFTWRKVTNQRIFCINILSSKKVGFACFYFFWLGSLELEREREKVRKKSNSLLPGFLFLLFGINPTYTKKRRQVGVEGKSIFAEIE